MPSPLARFTRLATVALVLAWLLAIPSAAGAADGTPAGPPFPEPVPGQAVYDTAGILTASTIRTTTLVAERIATISGGALVLYTQVVEAPDPAGTAERAHALLAQWAATWPELGDGVVVLVEQGATRDDIEIAYAASGTFLAQVSQAELDDALATSIRPVLETTDVNYATTVAMARLIVELSGDTPGDPVDEPGAPADAPPPGPPFPEPEIDRAVYDFAGVFSPETVAAVEASIDAIEERTRAEIVVYTQVVDDARYDETERHAIALIDQWGVGRAGFDDGLAIFFDFEPGRSSGQVQLYAAPGFAATFLTNSERQAIFDNDMLPHLLADDWDAAILAAMDRIDDVATPETAARLQLGRQVNAVVGLVGAPLVLIGLIGWAGFHWLRYGDDPVYLDSPSIYVPAPPPDLTAASAALVMDGKATRRALTTAMLDLASRGLIAFREESGMLGLSRKVGVELEPQAADAVVEARRERNGRRPFGPAERLALTKLKPLGRTDDYIEPDELLGFGSSVGLFNTALERHVVANGWFREGPSKSVGRWTTRGGIAFVGGILLVWAGFQIPMDGLTLVGGASIVAALVLLVLSRAMPAVTMAGAMIRAQLAAYRRTLQKTMEQARSMDQVVATAGLTWLDTPDQAVVWGTALGLQDEIERVLERSLDDVKAGRATTASTYFPAWYGSSDGSRGGSTGSGGGSIFSGSGIPNLGGMMSAIGTIGNSPSSSGSGGGFSGGSSGGGGGGAGGGF